MLGCWPWGSPRSSCPRVRADTMIQSSRREKGFLQQPGPSLGADAGGKKKGPLSCQEQKQPLHSITLTGCWGALTLHWGEEQSPKWRRGRGDPGGRNVTPAITFHPFLTYPTLCLPLPPQNLPSSAGAAPLPQSAQLVAHPSHPQGNASAGLVPPSVHHRTSCAPARP